MRLLLMRMTTGFRTALELGLKQPGEPGAESLKFMQCMTFEQVPPSRCVL
jgi:hypothetical protein